LSRPRGILVDVKGGLESAGTWEYFTTLDGRVGMPLLLLIVSFERRVVKADVMNFGRWPVARENIANVRIMASAVVAATLFLGESAMFEDQTTG